MNELIKGSSAKSEQTFTSLFIREEINKFRRQDHNGIMISHSDLLKKINREFVEEINEGNISPVTYKDKKGELRKMYELNYDDSLQLLMSESRVVRKGVVKVLRKLRETHQVPTNFIEAMQLATSQAIELEAAKPAIDLHNAITTSDKLLSVGESAQLLDYGRNSFYKKLRELGYLLKAKNRPKQSVVDLGLMVYKVVENSGMYFDTVLITGKGLDHIKSKLIGENI